jgi:selenocysteine lyase/cysteine desulfurase
MEMTGTDVAGAKVAKIDIARVRGLYPTLATRTAQLDGSFAALQPESVIRAIISTLRAAPAQPGSRSTRSQQSATRVNRARRAAADLVKARPEDVVLSGSTVSLLLRFATLLSGDWQLGDEVVLSRLDADIAVRPWQRVARGRGGVVRWAEVDLETGELPTWQYENLIGRRTRIVTVSLANPATGTVPDVRAIADLAHRHGALVVVDAGVAPAYLPLDIGELGADLMAVAAPVFGGPTVAAMIVRPGLLQEIRGVSADDVLPPENFEVPPLPIELLDGFTAAVIEATSRSRRVPLARSSRSARWSMAAVNPSSSSIGRGGTSKVSGGSTSSADTPRISWSRPGRTIPGLTLLGAPERALPVAAFTLADRSPHEVGAFLQRRDVSAWTGPAGMGELLRTFGADEIGGAVFVGLMPHSTRAEISQLIDALRALARSA